MVKFKNYKIKIDCEKFKKNLKFRKNRLGNEK